MLLITHAHTKQASPSYLTLEWVIQSTAENLSDYRLHVFRSHMASSNLNFFTLIASGIDPQVTYGINDTSVWFRLLLRLMLLITHAHTKQASPPLS